MGQHFGELYKMQAIVTFAMSPFEQRAYAGAIKHGVGNMFRRFAESFIYVSTPPLIAAFFYTQIEAAHEKRSRKNPKDYENDE